MQTYAIETSCHAEEILLKKEEAYGKFISCGKKILLFVINCNDNSVSHIEKYF